jgi:hypothetical protein
VPSRRNRSRYPLASPNATQDRVRDASLFSRGALAFVPHAPPRRWPSRRRCCEPERRSGCRVCPCDARLRAPAPAQNRVPNHVANSAETTPRTRSNPTQTPANTGKPCNWPTTEPKVRGSNPLGRAEKAPHSEALNLDPGRRRVPSRDSPYVAGTAVLPLYPLTSSAAIAPADPAVRQVSAARRPPAGAAQDRPRID